MGYKGIDTVFLPKTGFTVYYDQYKTRKKTRIVRHGHHNAYEVYTYTINSIPGILYR